MVLSRQGYGDAHVAGGGHLCAHGAHVEVRRLLRLREGHALAAAQHPDDLIHGGAVVGALLDAEKGHVDVPLHRQQVVSLVPKQTAIDQLVPLPGSPQQPSLQFDASKENYETTISK